MALIHYIQGGDKTPSWVIDAVEPASMQEQNAPTNPTSSLTWREKNICPLRGGQCRYCSDSTCKLRVCEED